MIGEGIVIAVISGAFLIANQLISDYNKRREARAKPDLSDADYQEVLGPILDLIRDTVGAKRVFYLAGQNGEKTLDGYSIKKMSMMAESNDDTDDIRHEFQSVPTVTLYRTLSDLKKSADGLIISNEGELSDPLAKIYRSFGINTMVALQVHNLKHGKKWTGVLCVCFEERERPVHATDLGCIELHGSRISALVSKL